MEPHRQAVCDLATELLGPGKLRILDDGEFYWISDHGGRTHLGWNLAAAMGKLRSMRGPAEPPKPRQAGPLAA
jgi:hypothetical protein